MSRKIRPFRVLRLAKVLKIYKNSAIFQAFLCPTLPSKRPPESVGEPPCILNSVPANLRKDLLSSVGASAPEPHLRSAEGEFLGKYVPFESCGFLRF